MTAGIAQLVEHDLAKVGVASSSLVSRSKFLYSLFCGYKPEKAAVFGALAKRLCSGLQIRLVRFDSGTRLQISRARVVKSVDTRDLKSLGVRAVRVQVPPRAPRETKNKINDKQCRRNHLRVVFYCLKFGLMPPFPPSVLPLITCMPHTVSDANAGALSECVPGKRRFLSILTGERLHFLRPEQLTLAAVKTLMLQRRIIKVCLYRYTKRILRAS